MKTCCRCRLEKDVAAFGKASREADGLRPECKACRKGIYLAGAEESRAKQTAYYHANVEARRAAQQTYNRAHASVICQSMRERRAAWTDERQTRHARSRAEWASRNPEKVRAASAAARHARRLASIGTRFSGKQWLLLCALYQNRCACCLESKRLTPDHIVPLSRGGSNHIANIQPLCLLCNQRKWTKTIVYGMQPYVNPALMLADKVGYLAGDLESNARLPEVYRSGALQAMFSNANGGNGCEYVTYPKERIDRPVLP